MSKLTKDLFINSAPKSIEINGDSSIPTTVFHQSKSKVEIGTDAILESGNRLLVNEDFKVDLGNIDSKNSHLHKKFTSSNGDKISSVQLTSDFLRKLFEYIKLWLSENQIVNKPNILIAEPLALQEGEIVEDKWLKRYRSNLKTIMSGTYYNLENISFLPEPFAVFQYYRYGYKHPILAERTKNNALVIDFGGGTFDVCIIETTKTGDIKIGGKHSRPLAAASVPYGGYFVNRILAEYLLKKISQGSISKGVKLYNQWRKETIELEDLNANNRNFIKNFHNLIYVLESVKINLCKKINDWNITNIPNISTSMSICANPFDEGNKKINVKFSAKEFFNIFKEKIWSQHLKSNIERALKRGKEELKGGEITVVLLSGGSSNIGWIREFISCEFQELKGIEIFNLPNFQEVVSQGLAIECARQYFTDDKHGDFSTVTYNRLCLVLDPNENGAEVKAFKPKTNNLPTIDAMPGVLLPSASILKDMIDKPLTWKIKLNKRPSRKLDYYFLRSSTDHSNLENLMNIVDKTVFTPANAELGNSIQVQITVKEDGTAIPKFIYKTGRNNEEITSLTGKPFLIDMTYEQQSQSIADSYIGLDFGTSNTSVSYIDETAIKLYSKRSGSKKFIELSNIVDALPYPLAITLSGYLSQTNPDKRIANAREFVETSLAVAAYISYIDYCQHKGSSSSKIFKGFTKRSAGPLWKLLQEVLKKMKGKSDCSKILQSLIVNKEKFTVINKLINELTEHKHEKLSSSQIDVNSSIQIIANIFHELFSIYYFGFVDNVKQKKFKKGQYEGHFRVAHGKPPFVKILNYCGNDGYDSTEALLIDRNHGKIIPLFPLVFWNSCAKHPDLDEPGHCYFYDKSQNDIFTYKAASYTCICNVTNDNEYESIAESIVQIITEDKKLNFPDNGEFTKCLI